jgi:hypothetical protein
LSPKWEISKIKPIYQIFAEVGRSGLSEKQRVEALKQYNHPVVKGIFYIMFDQRVECNIAADLLENVPYKPATDNERMMLYSEARRLKLFQKGLSPFKDGDRFHEKKKQMCFIETLEVIHPEDAKLVIAMFRHECPYPDITKKVVAKAFPDLGL